MTEASVWEITRRLPEYRIEAQIGRGGMSVVYLAQEVGLERRVALKVLDPALANDEGFRARFIKESHMVANLDHQSIIPVYRAGEADGLLYIAMRYVEGADLGNVLALEGRLPVERTLSILGAIANALDFAHTKGLIHRDVKPANILIATPGTPTEHFYLCDFGITKDVASREKLTARGHFIGTVDYMAPEQFEGNPDFRTDVYALGCVLYECLTGDVPFPRPTDQAVMLAHVREDPPPVSTIRDDVPPALDDIVARAMAKQPADRYTTCTELIREVRQAVTIPTAEAPGRKAKRPRPAEAPAAPPPGRPTTPAGPSRAKRPWAKLAAVGAVAMVAVAGFFLLKGGGEGFPNSDEQSLLNLVPTSVRESCTRDEETVRQAEGEVAAVKCAPDADDGPEELTLLSFENEPALQDDYEGRLDDSPVPQDADDSRDCHSAHEAEHEYTNTQGDSGRVFCFTRGDDSVIVWTDPEHKALGAAARYDGDDSALYNWWEGIVDRPEDDRDLSPEEQRLLDRVPDSFRDTCEREGKLDQETEVASFRCSPEAGADTVIYTTFKDLASLTERYESIRTQNGVSVDQEPPGPSRCPLEEPYAFRQTGGIGGRRVCYLEGPFVRITWTDNRLLILAEAIRQDGDSAELLEFADSPESGPKQ